MSEVRANPFYPSRWTALTWLAILLWAWRPIALNIPRFETYAVNPVTGELSQPTRYKELSELPFPVGWPLYYLKPSYLTTPVVPMLAGAPVPPPAPSSIHPFALITNAVLVVIAISSLVYILQKGKLRFSFLFLIGVMTLVPLYFGLSRLITALVGYEASRWYSFAVYFSPVPAALAMKFSIFPQVSGLQSLLIWTKGNPSFDEYANADDALAAASKLEMCGDWDESMDLYQLAAKRWPEHSAYAQICIDQVNKKQALAQSNN